MRVFKEKKRGLKDLLRKYCIGQNRHIQVESQCDFIHICFHRHGFIYIFNIYIIYKIYLYILFIYNLYIFNIYINVYILYSTHNGCFCDRIIYSN